MIDWSKIEVGEDEKLQPIVIDWSSIWFGLWFSVMLVAMVVTTGINAYRYYTWPEYPRRASIICDRYGAATLNDIDFDLSKSKVTGEMIVKRLRGLCINSEI